MNHILKSTLKNRKNILVNPDPQLVSAGAFLDKDNIVVVRCLYRASMRRGLGVAPWRLINGLAEGYH
jgi:hypothetical protein